MWNNPIGIESGIFCEEFLISADSNNPRSTCCCGYRGFLIPIISGPPGKSFVGLFSTIATGPFHSTCPARSWRRPLILEFIRSCGTFRRFRTVTSSHPPHVAAGLDEFRFPGTPQHVHYTSALASYYVDLSVYEVQVHERLRKWCLHHGLPLDQFHAPLMQHLRREFLKHRQHASTHQLLTKHQLNILHRHLGQDFVCHNEDHDNHHLMFFCPQLYFKGLHNTWLQSGTFAATPLKPDQAEALIVEAIPRHLQKKYKWAYRKKTTAIPVGKVFLKRKKQWKSGRTIIAYHKVVHRQLFKAVAILLGEIAASTWKCSWGVHPTPRIWQNVKQYTLTTQTIQLLSHFTMTIWSASSTVSLRIRCAQQWSSY